MDIRHLVAAVLTSLLVSSQALAIDRDWQGQSPPSWGFALNWTPIGLPQPGDDITIGSTQHVDADTELNTDYTINDLRLIRGADVDTNGHKLTIDGNATFGGTTGSTTSRLVVSQHSAGPAATSLELGDLALISDGELLLDGGRIVAQAPGTAAANISLNSNSVFGGYGVLRFQDSLPSPTNLLLNPGTIQTSRPSGAPDTQRYTLRIEASNPQNALISLFATTISGDGLGTVNLAPMTTLDLDTRIGPSISNQLNLAAGSILDATDAVLTANQLSSTGQINVNAGSTTSGVPSTAIIRGLQIDMQAESQVNVNSGTLVFEKTLNSAPTSAIDIGQNAGLQVDDTSTIDGDINFNSTGTSLVVNGILDINDPVFDWDGSEDGVTTVNAGGDLNITTTNLESGAGNASFDGTINLDGGSLQVNVPSAWTMAGDWNFINGGDYFASIGTITVTGDVHVSGGTSQMTSSVVFADGSTTTIQEATDIFSVNGEKTIEAGALFAGSGVLRNSTNGDLTLADGANVQVPFLNSAGLTGILADLFIEDGIGQARVLTFDQTSRGQVFFELASATQYDQLNVDLTAFIDGMLQVELLGAFNPAVGDAFTILSTGTGVFGQFDNSESSLPALLGGRKWFIDYGDNEVTLRVLYSADADNDGDVDGDDFLRLQRRNPSLINTWRSQYGSSIPALATTQAVPEPTTSSLVLVVAVLLNLRRQGV